VFFNDLRKPERDKIYEKVERIINELAPDSIFHDFQPFQFVDILPAQLFQVYFPPEFTSDRLHLF